MTNAPANLLTTCCEWTTLAANVITIIAFIAAAVGAIYAGRRFFRQRRYEQLSKLYALANDLFRAGLSIQKHRHEAAGVTPDDKRRLLDARHALANWYYDNRFLFEKDPAVVKAMHAVDDEAHEILATGDMSDLVGLKELLEGRLHKAP